VQQESPQLEGEEEEVQEEEETNAEIQNEIVVYEKYYEILIQYITLTKVNYETKTISLLQSSPTIQSESLTSQIEQYIIEYRQNVNITHITEVIDEIVKTTVIEILKKKQNQEAPITLTEQCEEELGEAAEQNIEYESILIEVVQIEDKLINETNTTVITNLNLELQHLQSEANTIQTQLNVQKNIT
jgi:hypothetical protein